MKTNLNNRKKSETAVKILKNMCPKMNHLLNIKQSIVLNKKEYKINKTEQMIINMKLVNFLTSRVLTQMNQILHTKKQRMILNNTYEVEDILKFGTDLE